MIIKINNYLAIFLIGLALISCTQEHGEASSNTSSKKVDLTRDIQKACDRIPIDYIYFYERSKYWNQSCQRAKDEAAQLEGSQGVLAVLERLVDDLYDPHLHLNTNNDHSPRLVPSNSDLWFELRGDNYVVTAVRPDSGAAKAGIRLEDQLIRFNGLIPKDLALTRIFSGRMDITKERRLWAINAAIAGRRDEPRIIELRRGEIELKFDLQSPDVNYPNSLVDHKIFPDRIGYIRFNDSLDSLGTVEAFNLALDDIRDTKSLIIDLRTTPSGGNTDVAEPILAQFINRRISYQRTVLRDGSVVDRIISPSELGFYDKTVIVLVGRWTGSMGEGMAVGFDAMNMLVMGSPMAGLAGGTEPIILEETGVSIWVPIYDLHHINGTPRHEWQPTEVLTADNGNEADILLEHALNRLRQK